MTDVRPSILTTGTQSLRSYEKDGVHRQASPVQAYYQFRYDDELPANEQLFFTIPDDMQLLSFYISFPVDVTINSNSLIAVQANDNNSMFNGNPFLSLAIPALALNLGNLLAWEPKFLIAQKDWTLNFTFNFKIIRILFYGSPTYIETKISGRKTI